MTTLYYYSCFVQDYVFEIHVFCVAVVVNFDTAITSLNIFSSSILIMSMLMYLMVFYISEAWFIF